MSRLDLAQGLLSGLTEGYKAYQQRSGQLEEAAQRKAEREMLLEAEKAQREEQRNFEKQKLKADYAGKGIDIDFDEQGNIVQKGFNPEFEAREIRLAQAKKKAEGASYDPYKALQLMKLQDEVAEKARAKTPQGKLEKMSGEARSRFDNVTGAINALEDIKSAYKAKPRSGGISGLLDATDMVKIPLRGDTPYTEASRRFEELLGRMQSGAQISEAEGERFRSLLPGPLDSPEIAEKKLNTVEQLLQGRLTTFGISSEDAKGLGLLGGGLQQTQKPAMSIEDQQALQWAMSNSKDPRAQKILQMNKMNAGR